MRRFVLALVWLGACNPDPGTDVPDTDDTDVLDTDTDVLDTDTDVLDTDTDVVETDDTDVVETDETDDTDDTVPDETDTGEPETDDTDVPDTDTDTDADTDTDTDTLVETGWTPPGLSSLVVGDLEIVEVLQNPLGACGDPGAEYVELVLRASHGVDLQGLVLVVDGDRFSVPGELRVRPGQRVVLGAAGGVGCPGSPIGRTVLPDFDLPGATPLLVVEGAGGVTLTTLDLRAFPTLLGQSWEKDGDGVWCPGDEPILGGPDLGSPGRPNGPCPGTDTGGEPVPTRTADELDAGEVLITEVLVDPGLGCRPGADFVELLNTTDARIDLYGAIFANDRAFATFANHVFLEPAERLVLATDAYVFRECFGRVADVATGLPLADPGDRVRLSRSDFTTVLDAVDVRPWGSTPGRSWRRDDLDANVWCLTELADGGATPGGANGTCPGADTDTDTDTDTDLAPDTDTDTDTDLPPDTDTDTDTDTDVPFVVDTAIDPPPSDLLLTDVMDYGPDSSLKLVEVTNAGVDPAPLAGWSIVRYANGTITPLATPLDDSVTLQPGQSWVVGRPNVTTDWLAAFGRAPNQDSTGITGNGDDAYALEHDGVIIDVFGEIGVLGLGTDWEYVDGCATRVPGVRRARRIWRAAEWSFGDCSNLTFGTHDFGP